MFDQHCFASTRNFFFPIPNSISHLPIYLRLFRFPLVDFFSATNSSNTHPPLSQMAPQKKLNDARSLYHQGASS